MPQSRDSRRLTVRVVLFVFSFLDEPVLTVLAATKMTSANLDLVMAPDLRWCGSDSVVVAFNNAQ